MWDSFIFRSVWIETHVLSRRVTVKFDQKWHDSESEDSGWKIQLGEIHQHMNTRVKSFTLYHLLLPVLPVFLVVCVTSAVHHKRVEVQVNFVWWPYMGKWDGKSAVNHTAYGTSIAASVTLFLVSSGCSAVPNIHTVGTDLCRALLRKWGIVLNWYIIGCSCTFVEVWKLQ